MVGPWTILALVLLWIGSIVGAFTGGVRVEADHKDAMQARENKIGEAAAAQASYAAASAIASIRVVNTTIQSKVQHEIETHTVYRDCEHTPDGLRFVNAALTNTRTVGELAGGSLVPRADPASGPQLRLDLQQTR
jgi:hypothetical protein